MASDAERCRRGHVYTPETTQYRNDGTRRCRICKRQNDAAWRARQSPLNRKSLQLPDTCNNGHRLDVETVILWHNEWRCPQCRTESLRQYRVKKYGITSEQYEMMLEEQNYQCPICERAFGETGEQAAIDHDHETGAVRGLLCKQCNLGIGNLQDDVTRVRNALQYLLSHTLLG